MKCESYVLEGGTLVLPDRVLEGGCVTVVDGRIESIAPRSREEPRDCEEPRVDEKPKPRAASDAAGAPPPGLPRLDARGAIITPGFMEMHIHGAGGIGFDAVSGGTDILAIRDFLLARGVTAFVPTLLCDERALIALVDAIDESGLPERVIPGIYVEGPFVNPKRRGGIPESLIRPVDPDYLRRILRLTRGKIRIMTVAPELPGIESVYAILQEAGVMISLGHSDCDPAVSPLPAGIFSITHLFNAMSGISHRQAGLANLAFSDSRPFVELNADSIHVNRECMRLVAAGIGPGRLVLTSDAVVAAGLPFGTYRYFGHSVVSGARGVRYGTTDTLMGSNSLGPQILRSWLAATDAPLADSVLALTATPSRLLGMSGVRGRLAEGMMADLVIWDKGFATPAPSSRVILGKRGLKYENRDGTSAKREAGSGSRPYRPQSRYSQDPPERLQDEGNLRPQGECLWPRLRRRSRRTPGPRRGHACRGFPRRSP